MRSVDGARSVGRRNQAQAWAGLLLGTAFALSQWSDFLLARWLLRLLTLAAVLLVLALPGAMRGRLRLPLALTAFLAWCLVSYLWTADAGNSTRRLVDLVALLSVGWVTGQVLGVDAVRRALTRTVQWMLVISAASLLAAPGWATAPGLDGAPGWHGPFPHKNGLGFFCAFAAITVWTAVQPGWPRRRWLALVLVLLIGSQCASALAALLAAAAAMAWHAARSGRAVRTRLGVDAATAALLGGVAVVALFWPALLFGVLGRDSSLTGRLAIWTAVERWIGQRPLLGYGFGGVWEDSSLVTLAIWRESRFEAFYAHSGYLDVLLQVGAIGLVLVIAVLVGLVAAAIRAPGRAGQWSLGVLVLLLLTAVTESAPFTGNGLLVLAVLVSCLTAPAPPGAAAGGSTWRPASRPRPLVELGARP